jgi:YbbR domain-containing protein
VREVDTSPREVQIQVEATASRNFSLTQQLPTATDDSRTVTSVTPEVSEVTVTGPESAVDRVDRVLLPIELGENTDDFTAGFAPVAVDARNQPISEVQILPERVSAFVAVQTRGKSVSVVPQTSGAPTEGYSVIQRTVMPQTVVVDGPAELLEDLLFVETEPVNIEGRTESLVQQAPITGLPEGVTVVDPATSQVEVTVVIQEAAVEQGLPNQPVETIGLNPRYTARVEPETVTVVLDAPRDLLRAMNADDVKVRVDLSGRGPGTYELRPDVTVPPGVTWNGNEPQTVRIVIEHAPADGTPLPIATPD